MNGLENVVPAWNKTALNAFLIKLWSYYYFFFFSSVNLAATLTTLWAAVDPALWYFV